MKELIRFLQALLGRNTVYYIGGSDVLPPPLKGAEEQQALRDLEAGDENAKQLLIALSPGPVSDGGGYQSLIGGI